MTYATVNNRRKSMSVYEKAMLLIVSVIAGLPGILAVSSGSEEHLVYQVKHNGQFTIGCNCKNTLASRCSHRIAGDWFLQEHPQDIPVEPPNEVLISAVCGQCVHIDIYSDCVRRT